ncbi:MAG: hypothetical protein LBN03_01795 [Bifidobacteriaceae bacterium]|jgi:hypothetical protein|nr:hypothetical protein [Bifidobacteriaceae bacterium]
MESKQKSFEKTVVLSSAYGHYRLQDFLALNSKAFLSPDLNFSDKLLLFIKQNRYRLLFYIITFLSLFLLVIKQSLFSLYVTNSDQYQIYLQEYKKYNETTESLNLKIESANLIFSSLDKPSLKKLKETGAYKTYVESLKNGSLDDTISAAFNLESTDFELATKIPKKFLDSPKNIINNTEEIKSLTESLSVKASNAAALNQNVENLHNKSVTEIIKNSVTTLNVIINSAEETYVNSEKKTSSEQVRANLKTEIDNSRKLITKKTGTIVAANTVPTKVETVNDDEVVQYIEQLKKLSVAKNSVLTDIEEYRKAKILEAHKKALELNRRKFPDFLKVAPGQHIVETARSFVNDEENARLYSEKGEYQGIPNYTYLEAYAIYDGGGQPDDCGNFVTTTVKASGVDSSFTTGNTSSILKYLQDSPYWDEVENIGSIDNLIPGDVFVYPHDEGKDETSSTGHTLLYLGNNRGAQASLGNATPYEFSFYSGIQRYTKEFEATELTRYTGPTSPKTPLLYPDGTPQKVIWASYKGSPYHIFRVHY